MPLTRSDRVLSLLAGLTVWYDGGVGRERRIAEVTMPEQESVDKSTVDDEAISEDETRRRFREALDRKQQQHHASAEAAARDGSDKSHGAQGPTKGRTFRR